MSKKIHFRLWKISLYIWMILNLTSISLKFFGLKRSIKILKKLATIFEKSVSEDIKNNPFNYSRNLALLTDKISEYTFLRTMCLEKSLTIWHLLLRKDIKSEFQIGSKFERELFKAHAWVKVNGKVISENENPALSYIPFSSSKFTI